MTGTRAATLIGLALVAGLLLAGPAGATSYGYVNLTYYNCTPTQAASTSLDSGVNWQGPWYTGQYNLLVNSATNSHSVGDMGADLWNNAHKTGWIIGTYCIDIRQEAPTPSDPPPAPYRQYDLYNLESAPVVKGMTTAMGTTKANDLRRLFSQWNSGFSNDQAGAFEAAVWEIINETSQTNGVYNYGLSSGTFRVSEYWGSGWSSIANTWLTNLHTYTPNTHVVALVNQDFQDYALTLADFGGSDLAIPEPLTMAGMLLGVGGIVGYVRRRVRK